MTTINGVDQGGDPAADSSDQCDAQLVAQIVGSNEGFEDLYRRHTTVVAQLVGRSIRDETPLTISYRRSSFGPS